VFIGNMCPFVLINTAAFIAANSCGSSKLTLDERDALFSATEEPQLFG
jgi:hypothetical protein